MPSTLSRSIVFIFEEPQSTDERVKSLARSQALSHASLWYHRRRRERQALEASVATRTTYPLSRQKHIRRKRTDQDWRDCSHALPPPTKLFSTWTVPEFKPFYHDMDFYVHQVAPQFHLAYKIFDVFDIYDRYFLRSIPKLARMTWQCNIASFRTRTSPTGIYQDQYYERYGEVLLAYRKKMLATNHGCSIDDEMLEAMVMLINVSFKSEGLGDGDIHLRRLLDLLKENRNKSQQEGILFLQCLLRQWYSHWKIVRGRSNVPACVKDFCHDSKWQQARLINTAETSTLLSGGFRRLADAQRLSAPTVRVLVRMTSCLLPQHHPATVYNTETFQDFEDSCPCLRTEDLTFEKMLCSTIMVYSNLVSSPNRLGCEWTLMFGARRSLLTDSLAAWPEPHPAEKACFVWIIATVALPWYEKLENIPDKTAGLFDCLFHMFGDLCWTDFITTVRDFIWDERFTSQLFEVWSVSNAWECEVGHKAKKPTCGCRTRHQG